MASSDFITLEDKDGISHTCQILDIFDFQDREYGLLLKLEEDNRDGSLVILELVPAPEGTKFRTIESDEEFAHVVRHVEELARKSTPMPSDE